MKNCFLSLFDRIDMPRVLDETRQLFEIELPQTFDAYHASADKAVELLKKSGIPQVEKLSFPADGKTAYQDKIMPMGWNASSGKAVIISAEGIAQGTVIADYRKHPFYLIKGSTSTLQGGEEMPLLTCEAVLAGADPSGAMVLSPLDQDCRCRALKTLLDRGARGVISDFSFNQEDAPEGILWNTAFTEFDNWHVNADDRDFIAFSILSLEQSQTYPTSNSSNILNSISLSATAAISSFVIPLSKRCETSESATEFFSSCSTTSESAKGRS
jgi:hypothetical protein